MQFKDLYLNDCLKNFYEYEPKGTKGGQEDLAEKVRDIYKKEGLTERIIELVQDEKGDYWPGKKYWKFPEYDADVDKVFQDLNKNRSGGVDILSDEEWKKTAKKLLLVIKELEEVSILFRFIRPEKFGIYSPPEARIVWVPAGIKSLGKHESHWDNLVEIYDIYLNNLKELKENAGFGQIAQVDMALHVHYRRLQKNDEDARKFEKNNSALRKIRVDNTTRLLFSSYDPGEVGKAVADIAASIKGPSKSYNNIMRAAGLFLSWKFESTTINFARSYPEFKQIEENIKLERKKEGKGSSLLVAAIKFLKSQYNISHNRLEICIGHRNDFVHENILPEKALDKLKDLKDAIELLEAHQKILNIPSSS